MLASFLKQLALVLSLYRDLNIFWNSELVWNISGSILAGPIYLTLGLKFAQKRFVSPKPIAKPDYKDRVRENLFRNL